MKKIFITFSFLISSIYLFSQYQTESGARQGGMANSGVIFTDIWSASYNQAGLADIKLPSAGIFYSNLFNIQDLKNIAFSVASPVKEYGTAGINYAYSGNEFSNFGKLGLAFSKRLGKNITAGIQLDYFRFAQANYGNANSVTGEIGFIAQPLKNFYIGAHVFNPWRAKFFETQEYLTSVLKIGAGYYFSEKVVLTVETEKETDKPVVFRAGTEYEIVSDLFFRAGVSTNPEKYSFGLGYNYKGVSVDVAYINHDILGYYLQFGLGYTLKEKSENESEPDTKNETK